MKSLKIVSIILMIIISGSLVNQSFAGYISSHYSYRVRTVPGSSDQKKKDAQQAAPKPNSDSEKNRQSFFSSKSADLKSRLDVVNGGTPK
ncbi:MAG: hypothetical protein H0V61_06515 [Chitinophagales bacterium]|nr:hypothetical protein [Chitinophagales bacterium]